MGLLVSVYRTGLGDCTNGGISSKATSLCVVNVEGPFAPSDERPAAWVNVSVHGVVRLVPGVQKEPGVWVRDERWIMNGGNCAGTSDSRWSDALQKLGVPHGCAIPIFDRIED